MAAPARRLIQPSCWAMFLTATAGWCLVLALTTTALPGISAQQVDFLNAPSASECRVHIEAALKQVVQEPASTEEEQRGDQADVESISNEGIIESAEGDSAGEESENVASAEDTTGEEDTASVEDGEASAETGAEDSSLEQPEEGDASIEGDSLEEGAEQDEGSLEQADETTEEGQSQENTEENESVEETGADIPEGSEQADSIEGEQSVEDVATGETAEESGSAEEQQASAEDTAENAESTEDAASLEQTDEPSTETGAESAEETGEDTEETTEQASVEETAGESEQESSETTGDVEQESAEGETTEQESTETAEETTENVEQEESVEDGEAGTQESAETPEESAQESIENAEEGTQDSTENIEESAQDSTENAEDSAQESIENAEESTQESTEDGETAEEGTVEAESVEESSQEPTQGEATLSEESAEAQPSEEADTGSETAEEAVESTETQEQTEEASAEEAAKSEEGEETEGGEKLESKRREVGEEPTEEESTESAESTEVVNEADAANATEVAAEAEELAPEFEIPSDLRPKDHVSKILRLDAESVEPELIQAKTVDSTLRELKRLYDTAIKPLEMLYKYRDLSNRHFGDPEIFSKPLILFMGPWSGGKSTIINYLMDIEYTSTALRTGAEPSPAYFNILMHGDREEVLDGTQLAADWTFSGLQKFGQGLLDRLRGLRLNNRLLEKVNIVEIPGILEIRKQVERVFPFNDACQWFIDRADVIFLVYDPSKLDVGPETEAILDQLKGREYQTRIILNKADQVRPEELMRVQGTLIWNISPLMSSSEPPVMYSTSLWAVPYEPGAPTRLLYAQEVAFLRDIRDAINKRVENKIASARRFAVRVRNHAKMVDCYLTTYYNHKTLFGNKQKISDDIIERPQNYHIYEGLSTLTNISRYDLPDPEVYRDFFKLNPLYEFQQLSATCTYFRGCPINRLDVAIAYDLPELVGKYKKTVEQLMSSVTLKS